MDSRQSPSPKFPSDTLPLSVLGLIVLCFVLHFATRLPWQSAAAAMPARAAVAPASNTYDLEICNRHLSKNIYVAVAYYDPLRRDWLARGWFAQKPGQCQVTMRGLTPPVFVYAESGDGQERWGDRDGDGVEFCLDPHKAFVLGQTPCRQYRQAPMQHFTEVPLTDGADGTQRFHWEITP